VSLEIGALSASGRTDLISMILKGPCRSKGSRENMDSFTAEVPMGPHAEIGSIGRVRALGRKGVTQNDVCLNWYTRIARS